MLVLCMHVANFTQDPILVHSVNLGSSSPRISTASRRMSPAGTQVSSYIGCLLPTKCPEEQIEFEMMYTDSLSISFSTSVLFNTPFPYFARLPISLTVGLSSFSSKVGLTDLHGKGPLIFHPGLSPAPTAELKNAYNHLFLGPIISIGP